MNQDEIKNFLLNFEAAEVRKDEQNNLEIFEVNFEKLAEIWRGKLASELGDFERKTGEKILAKIEDSEDTKAILQLFMMAQIRSKLR